MHTSQIKLRGVGARRADSAALKILYPQSPAFRYCFYGFSGAMIVNAFVPHLAATLALRKYAPGLATGLLILVPVNAYLIAWGFSHERLSWSALILSLVTVSLALLMLLPMFFSLGRKLTGVGGRVYGS